MTPPPLHCRNHLHGRWHPISSGLHYLHSWSQMILNVWNSTLFAEEILLQVACFLLVLVVLSILIAYTNNKRQRYWLSHVSTCHLSANGHTAHNVTQSSMTDTKCERMNGPSQHPLNYSNSTTVERTISIALLKTVPNLTVVVVVRPSIPFCGIATVKQKQPLW